MPLVLPLYYRWPDAEEAYRYPNQFLFGTELLVAPITEPAHPRTRLGQVTAWLPEGTWVDVLTDVVYDGGREIRLHRDLATIPVLAPAGAIVPLDGAAVPGNEPANPAALEIVVVAGADGAFSLVEDDGTDEGGVARTRLTYEQRTGVLTVAPVEGAVGAVPSERTWTVTFPALAVDGAPAAAVDDLPVPAEVTRTATRVSVTVSAVPSRATLRIEVGGCPVLRDERVTDRIFTLLDRAQIEHASKVRAFAAATSDRPTAVRMSHLLALDLDPELVAAIGEVLLARAPS